jgi:glycosyltransferase involved in cell wall biosynthesis
MKVLVLASYAPSLVRFRGDLIKAMAAAGHQVVACAPEEDDAVRRQLATCGVRYRTVPMRRAEVDVFADLRTLAALVRLLRSERPDLLLAYTQKPIVYGGLAAQLAGTPRFFAMVSGLGYAFTEGGGARRRLVRAAVKTLYRLALRRADGVFVFNGDDCAEMARHGILRSGLPVVQVGGSGVDLSRFAPAPLPTGEPVFLLIARLLRDKGVVEYVEAARRVRKRRPGVRFQLLGPLDPNPAGVSKGELDAWIAEGAIEYLGETDDVRPYLAKATVYVLPSYYREGLPRSIVEAMAMGRPVITTDAPGCRETTIHGENGYLVPLRDPAALAVAAQRFVDRPELAHAMGRRSRELAEARFDVSRINAALLAAMGLDSPAGANVAKAELPSGGWTAPLASGGRT